MSTTERPQLQGFQRKLLVIATIMGTGVSSLGLASSFSNLDRVAGPHGWGLEWPWILPVGMDLAIPTCTIAGLLLVSLDMPLWWVPVIPRLLTIATIYLNAGAEHNLFGKIASSVLVCLWVVFSEIVGHVYASLAALEQGARMESIRKVRWVLAPFSTVTMWRRMQLWEITSYRAGLAQERQRLTRRAELRALYGRRWRWEMPAQERARLRIAELYPAVPSGTPTVPDGAVPFHQPFTPAMSQMLSRTPSLTIPHPSHPTNPTPSATPVPAVPAAPVAAAVPLSQPSRKVVSQQVSGGTPSGTPSGTAGSVLTVSLLVAALRNADDPDNLSVRKAAEAAGVPSSTAQRYMKVAREVYAAERAAQALSQPSQPPGSSNP